MWVLTKDIYAVYNMVMIKANVFEVKAKFSDYLDRAARGEQVIVCRHNKPVAELRAIEDVRTDPRPIGPLPGRPTFDVPASFFEPMADEELDLWEGGAPAYPLSSEAEGGVSRVPETKADYGTRRTRAPEQRPARRPAGRPSGRRS